MHPIIKQYLETYKADGILITSLPNVRYLSGFTGSNAQLLISSSRKVFFTDGRYTTQAESEIGKTFEIITYGSGKQLEQIIGAIKRDNLKNILFEADHLRVKTFEKIKSTDTDISWIALNETQSAIRVCKSKKEIEKIRDAISIATDSLSEILSSLKAGKAEEEVAFELEFAIKKRGSKKLSFDTIVASGPQGALPHATPSNKKIKEGELVTIDYGATYEGYHSDETVTVCIGKPDKKQEEVYNTVKEAHDLAIEAIKPGITCGELDEIARAHISKAGYGENFTHSTGHGVGLEVHEEPGVTAQSETKLKTGMIITVEPGIYIEGWGGVRIEDMVLVTQNGHEILTKTDKSLRSIS
ncbi:M24 family metallopeptidase [Bdellovibrionota bacterium]